MDGFGSSLKKKSFKATSYLFIDNVDWWTKEEDKQKKKIRFDVSVPLKRQKAQNQIKQTTHLAECTSHRVSARRRTNRIGEMYTWSDAETP